MIISLARWSRAFRGCLAMEYSQSLIYRAQAIIWTVSGILPLIMLMIWLVLADRYGTIGTYAGLFYFVEELEGFSVGALLPAARFFFTYIIPLAFVTNIPAQAALGVLTWQNITVSIVFAMVSFTFCRWIWSRALKAYTSASS